MRHALHAWMIVLLLAVAGGAFADPPGRVGRLALVEGEVSLRSADGDGWQPALPNRPLTSGDEIATDSDGRAEIRIGSSVLRLDRLTAIEILRLDDDDIRVRLLDGRIALRIRSAEPFAAIHVDTRYGLVDPLGPGRYEIGYDNPDLWLASRSGALNFRAGDTDVVVGDRRLALVGYSDHTEIAWADVDEDAFSLWAAGRDRCDDDIGDPTYVSTEMTGYEDLYEYGEWHASAEYGALWYPRTVPPGWAPYRDGRWISISPWGRTWIDDAPWGFAPFHYGRWVRMHGRWGWTPGRHVARPIYAPALVAWIGGRDFGVGLSSGAAPYVGWFPLAPREVFVPRYRHSRKHLHGLNRGQAQAADIDRRLRTPQRLQHDRRNAVTVVPDDELRERSMRSRRHDLDRETERERRLEEQRRQRLGNERRLDDRMREQDLERRQLMQRQLERQRRDIDTRQHRFIERQRHEQRRREPLEPRRERSGVERRTSRPPQLRSDRSPSADGGMKSRAEDRRRIGGEPGRSGG